MPFAIPAGRTTLSSLFSLFTATAAAWRCHPEQARGTRASEGSACGRSFGPAALRMTSPLAPRNGRKKLQPPFRRARVCLESLGTAEPDGGLEERPRRGAVIDAEPGAHAQECVDREPAGRARRPTGREHVIRSRAVVAQDFRGSRTDEQRAIMAQPGRYGGRVPELELQVLRCNRVARRDPFV